MCNKFKSAGIQVRGLNVCSYENGGLSSIQVLYIKTVCYQILKYNAIFPT